MRNTNPISQGATLFLGNCMHQMHTDMKPHQSFWGRREEKHQTNPCQRSADEDDSVWNHTRGFPASCHISPEISQQNISCSMHLGKDRGEEEEEEIGLGKHDVKEGEDKSFVENFLNYLWNYNGYKLLLLCLIIHTHSCVIFSWSANKFVTTIF